MAAPDRVDPRIAGGVSQGLHFISDVPAGDRGDRSFVCGHPVSHVADVCGEGKGDGWSNHRRLGQSGGRGNQYADAGDLLGDCCIRVFAPFGMAVRDDPTGRDDVGDRVSVLPLYYGYAGGEFFAGFQGTGIGDSRIGFRGIGRRVVGGVGGLAHRGADAGLCGLFWDGDHV